MQDLKEIPMDQKHREEFIDIFDRTREANGYEKIEKADISELSSAHEAKASRCACFGELGFNDEAKASWFEPNLSLSMCFEVVYRHNPLYDLNRILNISHDFIHWFVYERRFING